MNLLSKLHRNSILTGPIENYCLVCGCLLRSEEESYAHIHEPSHVDKLGSVPQLVDFNDCIIKIKEGYFCRFCNFILPTIKRVTLHVTESKHRDNKTALSITRHNGVILAFDSVIINERSWNGLDGSTCSVCNEDYDDEEEHKKASTHVLNLIQIKCEFGQTYIYRKVDEELFFCLICNAILPLLEKQTHHETEKHLELFEKSRAEGTSVRNKTVPAIETNNYVAASSIELNNNSVKTPTCEPKNSQILDTKKADDNKPKAQDNNAQNQKVNDNTKESATLNTENVSVFNFQASGVAKNNGTQKEPTLNSPTQTIQPGQVNSTSEQTSKNKNTVAKNAETKCLVAAKVKVEENKEPKAKLNKEFNDTIKNQTDKAEPYLYEFLKARNFVIRTNEVTAYCTICDINIKDTDINAHHRDEHHRILCSKHAALRTKLSNLDDGNERETSRPLSNDSETLGKLKAKKSKVAVDKENVAPVSGQNIKKATSEANGKPVEAKEKIVAKESKDTVKVTVPVKCDPVTVLLTNEKEKPTVSNLVTTGKTATVIEQQINKENNIKPSENQTENKKPSDKENRLHSENVIPNQNKPNEINKGEIKQEPTETTAQNKKSAKKNQKKAAKAKVSKTVNSLNGNTVLPKEVPENKTALSEPCRQGTSETATTELTDLKELVIGDTTNLKVADTEAGVEREQNCVESHVERTDQEKEVSSQFESVTEIKTETLLSLLKTLTHIDSASDVVVNSKHVLGDLSFVLVVPTGGERAECVACGEHFSLDDVNMHVNRDVHRDNVEESLVVTSLEDEFIRQVKTQEYHCGYCNMLIPNWEEVEPHLTSYGHEDAKTSAAWRLELYQPLMRLAETREVRSILTKIFRCTSE